jgi:type III restriction enzyme
MALHPDFPTSPYAILDPAVRWFPADEALRESSFEKLMPPLVSQLRRKVQEWRDTGYAGATDTSRSLLNWWFNTPHLMLQAGGAMTEFQYYFAQREALETIFYLYDVVGVQDKYDLMRFDSSGAISASMFDESWRRFVVKMATGSGKTKVLALVLAWSFFHKLYEPESALARNFLVIAPNIIVLDRIYKDFQGLRIFLKDDPTLPDNGFDGRDWRNDFQLTLHLQDEVRITHPTGNIFLTNIHRVYAGDDLPPSPDDDDTMDYFLGQRPIGATTDSKVDLGILPVTFHQLCGSGTDLANVFYSLLVGIFRTVAPRLLSPGGRISFERLAGCFCGLPDLAVTWTFNFCAFNPGRLVFDRRMLEAAATPSPGATFATNNWWSTDYDIVMDGLVGWLVVRTSAVH